MNNLFENLTPERSTRYEYEGDSKTPSKKIKDTKLGSSNNPTPVQYVTSYDSHGNETEELSFNEDGSLRFTTNNENEYWDNGNLKSTKYTDDIEDDNSTRTFDEKGRLLTDTSEWSDTPFVNYSYDDENNKTIKHRGGNGKYSYSVEETKYSVDRYGIKDVQGIDNCKQDRTVLSVDGNIPTKYLIDNRPDSKIIERVQYNEDDNTRIISSYKLASVQINKCDEHNNDSLNEYYVKNSFDGEFELANSIRYDNQYDEQGRLISSNEYQSNNPHDINGWYDPNEGRDLLNYFLNMNDNIYRK